MVDPPRTDAFRPGPSGPIEPPEDPPAPESPARRP
ncbi:transcriptional regulator, partial [Propionibacterium freudenreichii]|nr:transcriptional regulator [Propionibacterium freudenreichii]